MRQTIARPISKARTWEFYSLRSRNYTTPLLREIFFPEISFRLVYMYYMYVYIFPSPFHHERLKVIVKILNFHMPWGMNDSCCNLYDKSYSLLIVQITVYSTIRLAHLNGRQKLVTCLMKPACHPYTYIYTCLR